MTFTVASQANQAEGRALLHPFLSEILFYFKVLSLFLSLPEL